MKKIIYFLIFTFAFSKNNINFYIYNLFINYKEYQKGLIIDKDYSNFGDMLGVGVGYKNKIGILHLKLNFEGAYGSSIYDGATWSGKHIKTTQNGVYLFNIKGAVGNKWLFLTVGYREWNRGKSNLEDDYEEIYYWKYWGLIYKFPFVFQNIVFVPQISYLMAVNPKLKVNFGNKPVLNLGDTDGKNIVLPIFIYCKNFTFNIYYRFEYWHINSSKVYPLILNGKIYHIYEPESVTKNQYIGFGILYKF